MERDDALRSMVDLPDSAWPGAGEDSGGEEEKHQPRRRTLMAFLRFSWSLRDFSIPSSISLETRAASCWRAMRASLSWRDSDSGGLNVADQESSWMSRAHR